MNFEDRIFKNFKSRAKEAFKHHKCEHLIPKNDHDQEYEKILGCDRFQFVNFLKSKFKDGMTESNYGIEGWHIDHIFPLARATPDNLIFWLHYLNTQPLWKKDNEDKCDYIFDLNEIRLVEKIICEAKQVVYTDTIVPTEVCKFSRPYLKELKNKGQITDQEILEIRKKHKTSDKVKNQKQTQIYNKSIGKPSKRKLKGFDCLSPKEVDYCLNNNIKLNKRLDGSFWVDNKTNSISHKQQNILVKNQKVSIPMSKVKEMLEENNKLRQRVQELEYYIKNNL